MPSETAYQLVHDELEVSLSFCPLYLREYGSHSLLHSSTGPQLSIWPRSSRPTWTLPLKSSCSRTWARTLSTTRNTPLPSICRTDAVSPIFVAQNYRGLGLMLLIDSQHDRPSLQRSHDRGRRVCRYIHRRIERGDHPRYARHEAQMAERQKGRRETSRQAQHGENHIRHILSPVFARSSLIPLNAGHERRRASLLGKGY